MFSDATAVIGINGMEAVGAGLAGRLVGGCTPNLGRAIFDAAAGLARIANAPVADALALVNRFLIEIDAPVVAIDLDAGFAAIEAFARFGKGRHPPGLNMGDCVVYARAKRPDAPPLCKEAVAKPRRQHEIQRQFAITGRDARVCQRVS